MNNTAKYGIPAGPLCLKGPNTRPAEGSLPLRGDLAHVALANCYLVAHYVEPQIRVIGETGTTLFLNPDDSSEAVVQLDAGATFEALDFSGNWCWGCVSAQGPSGYIPISALAPITA